MAYTRDDYMSDLYISEHAHGVEQTNASFRVRMYEQGRAGQIKGYASEGEDDWDPEFYDLSFNRMCEKVCAANELENFKARVRDRRRNYEISDDEQKLLHEISRELKKIAAMRNTQIKDPLRWNRAQEAIDYYERQLEMLLSNYYSLC